MSFVIAAPEMLQGAAQDLAGIHSSLAEATSAAAAPTTGVVAAAEDEVSTAIASMFGNYGRQFQVLSTQAQAFHQQFVNLMNGGAGVYMSAEVANVEQVLTSAVTAPARALSGAGGAAGALAQAERALESTAAPALLLGSPSSSLNGFVTTLAGPYQTLFANTAANLQALGNAVLANPAPFLRQFLINQIGYAQEILAGADYILQNLPAVLANLPANIQAAIHALLTFDPRPYLQQFITNQIGYAQTIATALGSAAHDFTAGVLALPSAFQSAFQALQAGNITGAVDAIGTGFWNLFLTGFNVTPVAGVFVITPTGTLGDLLPILAIPGQMAQNFTNLIPAGTIPSHIAQNFTNLIKTVTNTSVTAAAEFVLPTPGNPIGIDLTNTFGLPLVLGLEALGGPVNALDALGSSARSFINAVQTGNGLGAVTALVDAPAVVANGFLNGQATFPLTVDVEGLVTTVNLPLDGILVPAAPYTADILAFGPIGEVPVFGTPIGGIVPGLLNFLPEELAAALGAPPPFFPPPPPI
jgi:hypothetical protein